MKYPGAAAQPRPSASAKFREVDPTQGFGLSPNALNINGANTYQFVMGNPAGNMDPSGRATCLSGGSHPFNPMRAGIIVDPDRTLNYKYVYKFNYANADGYPQVGAVIPASYTVSGAGIPVANLTVAGAGISFGYFLDGASTVTPIPASGHPCCHQVIVTVTLQAYHEYGFSIPLNVGPIVFNGPEASFFRTELGTWQEYYSVSDDNGNVSVAPLVFGGLPSGAP
jgi:hypothetical protein